MVFVPLTIVIAVGLALWLRPWPLFLAPDESSTPKEQGSGRNVAWEFGKWVERQARARGLNVRGWPGPCQLNAPSAARLPTISSIPMKFVSAAGAPA
jgi:hypothetical protein